MLLLLAGGSGERMGGGKPFTDVGGRPLWRWMADGLTDAGFEVTVSVGSTPYDTTPYPGVIDPVADVGPLGGIAALAGSDVLVWTVDVPDWTVDELDVLGKTDIDAVRFLVDGNGRPQPLLAHWPASATEQVPAYLEPGRRAVLPFLDLDPNGPIGSPRRRTHLTTRTDVEEWLRSQP